MTKIAVLTSDLQYAIVQLKKERRNSIEKATPQLSDFYNKMRSLEIPIIHLQHISDPDDPAVRQVFGDNGAYRGGEGAKIIADFFHEDDIIIEKTKASGFYDTKLDENLKEMGIKTLIITGFQAQICVQTTAADAFFRGYKVIVPNDAVVSAFEEDRKRAVEWLEDYFAQIYTCEEIYNYLQEHDDFGPKTIFKGV